jgi:TRAP transporter TAXI family solute receptor
MQGRIVAFVAIAALAIVRPVPGHSAEPDWPDALVVATASRGGTYHAYGAGLAQMLMRTLDLPVTERTTEGPKENIQLVENGEAQIGFVTMGVALQAWEGSGDWTHGTRYRAIRALFPMYITPFQFVVRKDSGIRSLADAAGKRIGAGPQGGTAGTYLPMFLGTLNIEAPINYGSYDDLAKQLQDADIDLLAAAAGAPSPAIAGLDASKSIRFVPLNSKQIIALRLAMPELIAATVPAGTYPSLMGGYKTVGFYNFAIARRDLPSDLVYRIVEAVFSHKDELVAAHPAAAATVPANFVQNTFLPYHPGAARYYANLGAAGTVQAD